MQNSEIIKRIIPLPRNIKVSKGVTYEASRIRVEMPGEKTPPLKTASVILKRFADPGQICPDFTVKLKYAGEEKNNGAYKKLKSVKNRDQAYLIKSKVSKGVYKAIEITAFTDIGLLYGTLTLAQAVVTTGAEAYIPVLNILDWPEISYRGQWGGNSNCDLHWTFQYKLNAIDGKVFVTADDEGNPTVTHNQRLYDEASSYGVDIMATIPHLEQISRRGFLEKRKDVLNVPSEERKNRSDYFPGLCMSKQATEDMILEWFRGIAANSSVGKILVWLSEESTPCYCEDCNGDEPFQLETACLLRAYSRLKKDYPETGLGIMLSQGSFHVTKEISEMLPKDVSLTYYDGGRTYDSGKYPMILPPLRKFVKKGGRLGVYPQVTHSWRTVFPWMGPAFIKYRCDEFVKVGLERVIGYAIPSNRYHEFNLMAFAEWLWNPEGRSIGEFAGAYAAAKGIDEDYFVKYLKLMEKPGWQLAESKLLLRLTYNYPLILRGRVELQDHRYEMSELIKIQKPENLLRSAKKALGLAVEMDEPELICEARCVTACLEAYKYVTGFIAEIDKKTIDTGKLLRYYKGLRKCAETVRKNIMKWSALMIPDGTTHMRRVIDTSMILYRALDGIKRYFDDTNVQAAGFPGIVTHLGEWDEGSFNDKGTGLLEYDVTDYISKNGEGRYYLSLDYIESASGTDFNRITIYEQYPGGGEKPVAFVRAELRRISVWAPWIEYTILMKKPLPACRYILRMDISGMEKGAETCRGLAGIRKTSRK